MNRQRVQAETCVRLSWTEVPRPNSQRSAKQFMEECTHCHKQMLSHSLRYHEQRCGKVSGVSDSSPIPQKAPPARVYTHTSSGKLQQAPVRQPKAPNTSPQCSTASSARGTKLTCAAALYRGAHCTSAAKVDTAKYRRCLWTDVSTPRTLLHIFTQP